MNTCPRCGVRSPVRLAPNTHCAACRSTDAWSRLAEAGPLVIERVEIERAEARDARLVSRARLLEWAAVSASLVTCVASIAAVLVALHAFDGRAVDSPATIAPSLRGASIRGIVAGVAALALALLSTRLRARQRRSAHSGVRSAAAVGAAAALAIALVSLFRVSAYASFAAKEMPSVTAIDAFGPSAQRVMRSTVVVIAPDEDGDATNPAIGTASVIRRNDQRAILLTCAHVAMPYAVVGAHTDARDAQPVWLTFADGRSARGAVVWVGEPPLDVALLEVAIEDPPPALPMVSSASRVNRGDDVFFVPNPLLRGFTVHHGAVSLREPHDTPAGRFDLIDTDLPVVGGDSGSGLFDASGRLVGVNTWRAENRGATRGVSLPTEVIASAAESLGSIDVVQAPLETPP